MKKISSQYLRTALAITLIISEVVVLFFTMNGTIGLDGIDSVGQAIIGSILGISIISTISILLMQYQYSANSKEHRYEQILRDINLKHEILISEVRKQKDELQRIAENSEQKERFKEYVQSLEDFELEYAEKKVFELGKALDREQNILISDSSISKIEESKTSELLKDIIKKINVEK